MFIPTKIEFGDGPGQNTQLSGRTNTSTCSDQIINHLIRSLIVETLLFFIDDYHPVRYLSSLKHSFVNPSRGGDVRPGLNYGKETYRFHAPSRGLWHKTSLSRLLSEERREMLTALGCFEDW